MANAILLGKSVVCAMIGAFCTPALFALDGGPNGGFEHLGAVSPTGAVCRFRQTSGKFRLRWTV